MASAQSFLLQRPLHSMFLVAKNPTAGPATKHCGSTLSADTVCWVQGTSEVQAILGEGVVQCVAQQRCSE